MKKLITLAITFCMAGAAYAGCGTKVPVNGTLSAYDAEKKELTIKTEKGEEKVTLDAAAKVKDAKGEEAKIADLVGKQVDVSTDKHTKKGETVTETAVKKEE